MTERERLPEPDEQRGPRIYDAAAQPRHESRLEEALEGAEAALRRPLVGDADEAPARPEEPRRDPNLGNILSIVIIGAAVLLAIFGLVVWFTLS